MSCVHGGGTANCKENIQSQRNSVEVSDSEARPLGHLRNREGERAVGKGSASRTRSPLRSEVSNATESLIERARDGMGTDGAPRQAREGTCLHRVGV